MVIKLLRDARIRRYAGDIVEVSPAEANFLISTKSAVEVAVNMPKIAETASDTPKKATRKKSDK